MNYLKNATIIAAAILLCIAAPLIHSLSFAAHAQDPAPTGTYNLDEPGRIPYQSTIHKEGACALNQCFFEFGTVPKGHRLVITRISGMNSFNTTPTQVVIFANNGSNHPLATFLAPIANLSSVFDHVTQIFFDDSQRIQIQVSPYPGFFQNGNAIQTVSLSGYELDCQTAQCAPLAH